MTVLSAVVGLAMLGGLGARAADRDRGRSDWISDPALWLYSEGTFDVRGLSDDGRYALFEGGSDHDSGVGDANGGGDVFRRDMATGKVEAVSVRAAGGQTANQGSWQSAMSADGRYVTFVSQATDLDASVTDTDTQDVFLRDMTTGHTTMVSRSHDGLSGGDGPSANPRMTPDGRYVVFESRALNLVAAPGAGYVQLYRYDRQTGAVELVSAGPGGVFADREAGEASVSADGRFVAFSTGADNLVTGTFDPIETSDVFVRDMTKHTTTLVSRARNDAAAGASSAPRISADGTTVVFASSISAAQLTGDTDTNNAADLFVWDRASGGLGLVTEAVGGGAAADGNTFDRISLSSDGRTVAFVSTASNLVAGLRDRNNVPPGTLPLSDDWQGDVYVRRLGANQTVLVSRSAADHKATGDEGSDNPLLSGDGRIVTFESNADDLVAGVVDTNNTNDPNGYDAYGKDVFSYRISDGELRVVSLDDSAAESKTLAVSNEAPVITADGRFIAFDNDWGHGTWAVRRSMEPGSGGSTPPTTAPGSSGPTTSTTSTTMAGGGDGATGDGGSGAGGAGAGGGGSVPNDPARPRTGYWMVARDGAVYAFGDARSYGNAPADARAAVDLEPTPSGNGYWIVDETGRVLNFGDAPPLGDVDRTPLTPDEKVTSLSTTPSGAGYWIFTTRGRVLAFGDARWLGDMARTPLNGPVLDSIPTPSGKGYYMVASDGGIFAFGDAAFRGSMGGHQLNAPVESLVPDADGAGYWLVASDGGIFAFDAPFRGSMGGQRLNRPVTGMVRYGTGYLMVSEDGGIFSFSDRPFAGSLGATPPAQPIVSVAALG
jgi:Tol biopolymer transport system component